MKYTGGVIEQSNHPYIASTYRGKPVSFGQSSGTYIYTGINLTHGVNIYAVGFYVYKESTVSFNVSVGYGVAGDSSFTPDPIVYDQISTTDPTAGANLTAAATTPVYYYTQEAGAQASTITATLNPGYYVFAVVPKTPPLPNQAFQFDVTATGLPLFTPGDDTVNFNSLTPGQQSAIQSAPSRIYDGLGGDDVVTLPSAANFNESVGGGATLNWSSTTPFATGSLAGQAYTVNGTDGNYDIQLGAGSDTVTISGNGNSTITAGSGTDTISINGKGVNTINVGTGIDTITLNNSGNRIDFTGPNQIIKLALPVGDIENIADFETGDSLIFNQPNLTTYANPDSNAVDIFSASQKIATLIFDSKIDVTNIEPISGNGQTKLIIDPTPIGSENPAGTKILWNKIHLHESLGGVSVLTPYVPQPGGYSGITFAQGIDIGGQGNASGLALFTAMFGSTLGIESNAIFLSPGVGASDSASQAILKSGGFKYLENGDLYSTSVSLTNQQVNAATNYIEKILYNQLYSDYDAEAKKSGTGGWSTLSANQQTAILDIAFNIGLHRSLPHHGLEDLKLWTLLVKHSWGQAAARILKLKIEHTRAQDDAKLISGGAISENVFGLPDGNETSSAFQVAASANTGSSDVILDPFGHGTYVLTTASGSPEISTLTLPTSAANAYAVRFEQSGGTWSAPETVKALQTVNVPTGTASIQVQMLNADGSVDSNPSDLTFDVTFASSGAAVVKVTAPTVASTPTSPLYVSQFQPSQTGEVAAGATVTLTLAMSEAVTVNTSAGSPTLALDDGETAIYDAKASNAATGKLVFDYTVAAGDSSPNLYVTEVDLNGATVTDAIGNAADFSNALNTPTGLQVGAAVISSIQASPVTNDAASGQSLQLDVGMSQGLTLDTSGGAPTLSLSDGATATYDAQASSPSSGNLVFDYAVGSSDYAVGLTTTALNLNGAKLTDSNGIAADLSAANGFGLGFDVNAAVVNAVTASQTGETQAGTALTLTLTMNEAVVVNTAGGPPTLTLNDGATAAYDAKASNPANGALVFDYTVGKGDESPNLEITQVNLNGATINDSRGNAADFDDALYAPTGVQVGPAFISSIVSSSGVDDALTGQTLQLTVDTSQALTVNTSGGAPTLSLSDGAKATYDANASSASSGTLVFDYTVASSDYSVGLTTTSLNLNGATLTDSNGIAVDLSGANGYALGFDVNAAIVNSVTVSQTGEASTGAAVNLTLAMSEALVINTSGGSPTLTLDDGATATYDAKASNPAGGSLVFDYTVGSNEQSQNLEITQVNLNSATIQDGAGHAADFANALFAATGLSVNTPQSVPCFARGVRIMTDCGEVAVEDLSVGDIVVTASGVLRPIVWIGHREIDISRHPEPGIVRPVRISMGALARNIPHRDLVLSPEHALWFDDGWVAVRDLINGATIQQEAWSLVTYYHIELESHDILLAAGAQVESYLDCDNRRGFDNAPDGVTSLYPDWRATSKLRRFASLAATARLRAAIAQRARELRRGAHVDAFEARLRTPRTNFVRNPRGEDGVQGFWGAGGQAPRHWWLGAPSGIRIEVGGAGEEDGLPYVDLRFVGRAADASPCCIYPEPDNTIAASAGEHWTASCWLKLVAGSLTCAETFALYIDEKSADGAYLTGRAYRQPEPGAESLALQRWTATRKLSHSKTCAMTGYIQIAVAAGAAVDFTLRLAAPQIERGAYASNLILPPPGDCGVSSRVGEEETVARTLMGLR